MSRAERSPGSPYEALLRHLSRRRGVVHAVDPLEHARRLPDDPVPRFHL